MLVCVCVIYRADLYTLFEPSIVGHVLGPRLCVGACMLACVWYTELTCIPYLGIRRT